MAVNVSELWIKDMQVNGNRVTVITDKETVIHITAISPKTLEIWVDFEGESKRNKSYSIEKMPSFCEDISATDKGVYYLIQSGEAYVRLYKEGIRIEYVTCDDSQIICAGKEMKKEDDGAIFMSNFIAEKEHFYGLGEDNDGYLGSLDRRGQTRDMITGQRITIGHVTADIPVTFYMSLGCAKPYGIFTDNSYPMYYDMGKDEADVCYQKALGGDLIYYYFSGENFTDILNEYTNLTGKPPMPPLWTQGYIQCRCSYWNWEQIDEIVDTLKDNRIPVDCIVFDYDWAEYFNNYKWNPRWQGKSPAKIAEYRKQGLHFMVSNSGPMLKKDSDTYASALEAGVLARDTEGNTITCGHYGGELIDFSNPATKEWIQPQLEKVLDEGVESWWLDLTEPEGDPENTIYYDGDRNKVHNPFSLLNTKMYTEITREHCPDMRSFILTRTGTAGIQKYGTAIWSGDVYSDYKTFTAHIPEAMNTVMSGIPLWTSDAGGFISASSNASDNRNIYRNDIARHANLYERWVQFACFSPIMRVHHAGESAPFAFGEVFTASIAHYIRLRYKLLPYIYSYSYKSYLTGEPLMRPLVYNYPDDENVYDLQDEFLFGEDFIIAPVHEEEQCERMVYLPAGKWIDFDYGHEYEGGKSYTVYAPQNRIPVFVRAGAVIPMSDPIDNSAQLSRETVCAEIYPYEQGRFTMYSDDGISMAYEKGEFTLTDISYEENVGKCTVIKTSRSNDYFPVKTLKCTIHVNAVPVRVAVNGKEAERRGHLKELHTQYSCWFYNDFSRILYVYASVEPEESEILVTYDENALISHPAKSGEESLLGGQQAFILPPASVPCRIGFENFDRGGEGIAYHKETPDNEDAIYRSDNVGIETCSDIGCGNSVKNIGAGEWLEYTVNVLQAGEYRFRLRLNAAEGTCLSILDKENVIVSGLDISGEKWHDVYSDAVYLNSGETTIRMLVESGVMNGNYFEIIS